MVGLETRGAAGEQDTQRHRTAMVTAGQWKVLRDAEREEVQATAKAFVRRHHWGLGGLGHLEGKRVLRRSGPKWNWPWWKGTGIQGSLAVPPKRQLFVSMTHQSLAVGTTLGAFARGSVGINYYFRNAIFI